MHVSHMLNIDLEDKVHFYHDGISQVMKKY